MAVLRSPFSRSTYQSLLEADSSNKTPKRITDKLDLLDRKIDNIYSTVYTSRPDDVYSVDNTFDRLNNALDRLQGDDVSISNMSKMIQRMDKSSLSGNVKRMFGSINDLFSDQNIIQNVFATEEVHRYISSQNYQYDLICKYIPKLMDALEIKRDNVLCSDNFSKNFVNPKSNKSNKEDAELFSANIKRIENEYDFSEFLDKTYMNVSKYGEDFIYIVPYKVGFERIVERTRRRRNPYTGSFNFYESAQYTDSSVVVESGYINSSEFASYKEHVSNLNGNITVSKSDKSFDGLDVNMYFNTSGVLQNTINEISVIRDIEDSERFKSLSSIHEESSFKDNKFEDTISRNNGLTKAAQQSTDGLILNNNINIEPEKISDDILGAIVERLPRENIIPVYIGEKKCVGYYYLEFAEDRDACGFCGGHHTMPQMSNAGSYAYNMTEDQQELAIRFIANRISQQIDTKFINANKDLKEEIYAVLRYNEKFDIQRTNNIGVTFIPAEDIVHCYFELDEHTHRGISDLSRALVPAMLYILLYLTDIIGKITRSTDKRLYYVKQNVEQNIARTMMNTIYQIKKGNMGMRQIESMNSILNIVGQYNDHIIPVGPSGDPPIQFEVMQGQNIETPTEIMEKMEEAAINTILPIEMVNSTLQSDFATRFSMSNTRMLKDIYTRQRKTQTWASKMYTMIYNYEFDEHNKLIEILLPPPTYLTATNDSQLIDNIVQLIDKIIEIDLVDKSDEEKAEFKKIMVRNYLSTYFDFDQIEKFIKLAEVNIANRKDAAAADGEEDMGEYL